MHPEFVHVFRELMLSEDVIFFIRLIFWGVEVQKLKQSWHKKKRTKERDEERKKREGEEGNNRTKQLSKKIKKKGKSSGCCLSTGWQSSDALSPASLFQLRDVMKDYIVNVKNWLPSATYDRRLATTITWLGRIGHVSSNHFPGRSSSKLTVDLTG